MNNDEGDRKVTNSVIARSTSAITTPEATAPAIAFDYRKAQFRYDPFPIGLITPVLQHSVYEQLVNTFPNISLFKKMSYLGNKNSIKYSLAEMNNGDNYFAYLDSNPIWKNFYNYIKSPAFLYRTLEMLSANKIELGFIRPDQDAEAKPLIKKLKEAIAMKQRGHKLPLKTRFEFSVLPADGGQLQPHTDSPGKVITLVISMASSGDWNPAFGGSTDILKPKDLTRNFNYMNTYLDFDEVEKIDSYAFLPNQAIVFIKTFNSWHSVGPMTGTGSELLRRTLTINIEATEQGGYAS